MAHAKAVQDAGIRRYLKKRIAALEAENAGLKSRIDAAVARGRREGTEAALATALRWFESIERDRDRATATLAHAEAARLHAQTEGIAVVLASLRSLSPTPAPEEGR